MARPSRPPDTPLQAASTVQATYNVDGGRQIGTGGFAVVKACVHIPSGRERAVKIMQVATLEAKGVMDAVRHEKEILRRSDHPSIVRLHHCIRTSDNIYLAMDLMQGDLFDYIIKNRPLPEPDVASIMRQLVSAVAYLHEQSIVHRDIKPENILINSPTDVKLTDFGFAKIILSDVVYNSPKGTTFYIAPEVLRGILDEGGKPKCTTRDDVKQLDMWALGVTMYFMLAGRPPFTGKLLTREQIRRLLTAMTETVLFTEPVWQTISGEAKSLVSRLLSNQVADRLTAEAAREHPFLAKPAVPPPPLSAGTEAGPLPADALQLSQDRSLVEDTLAAMRGAVEPEGDDVEVPYRPTTTTAADPPAAVGGETAEASAAVRMSAIPNPFGSRGQRGGATPPPPPAEAP